MNLSTRIISLGVLAMFALVWPWSGVAWAQAEKPRLSVDLRQTATAGILKVVAARCGTNYVIRERANDLLLSATFSDLTCDEAFAYIASQAGLIQRRSVDGRTAIFRDPEHSKEPDVWPNLGSGSAQTASVNISLDFKQADVRDLVKIIAARAGVNILLHKVVRGNLSCYFNETPWYEALAALAVACNVEAEWCGSTVIVGERRDMAFMRLPEYSLNNVSAPRRSLNVHDLDLREAFGLAARAFGRDFITGVGVRGNITVSLNDITEDELLPLLAHSNGFDTMRYGGLWIIDDPRHIPELKNRIVERVVETATAGIRLSFHDASLPDVIRLAAKQVSCPVKTDASSNKRVTLDIGHLDAVSVLRVLAAVAGLSIQEGVDGITMFEAHDPKSF
ncbi:MAG: hypothetical protein HQM09_16530 [Candidatus Riflebacteria bacterium]|nr:hypothetical protein [Candidatus Riflebacteria bacterium]